GDRQGEYALAKAQGVVQDKHFTGVPLTLFDDIDAGDAEIHAAVAHADHNIRRALEEDHQTGKTWDARFVLARVGFVHRQAAVRQEVQAALGQAAFGRKRDTDGVVVHHLNS